MKVNLKQGEATELIVNAIMGPHPVTAVFGDYFMGNPVLRVEIDGAPTPLDVKLKSDGSWEAVYQVPLLGEETPPPAPAPITAPAKDSAWVHAQCKNPAGGPVDAYRSKVCGNLVLLFGNGNYSVYNGMDEGLVDWMERNLTGFEPLLLEGEG